HLKRFAKGSTLLKTNGLKDSPLYSREIPEHTTNNPSSHILMKLLASRKLSMRSNLILKAQNTSEQYLKLGKT
ncbi:hypothetical protein OnM2_044087, partial [Erysiphe neolycopersici]